MKLWLAGAGRVSSDQTGVDVKEIDCAKKMFIMKGLNSGDFSGDVAHSGVLGLFRTFEMRRFLLV